MPSWITNPWLLLFFGVAFGAVVSWVIARHYYLKTPQWALDILDEMRAAEAKREAEGDVDFVATFNRALKDHDVVINGGTF